MMESCKSADISEAFAKVNLTAIRPWPSEDGKDGSRIKRTALFPKTDCEKEQVHFIGRVQDFGFLLVLDEEMKVRGCSENVVEFGLPGSDELMGQRASDYLDFMKKHPKIGEVERCLMKCTKEEFLYTFHLHSNGVWKIFEFMPTSKGQQIDSWKVLDTCRELTSTSSTIEDLLGHVAARVSEISGYNRVLVYIFDEEYHGRATHEVCNGVEKEYEGIWFPESDIPAPARLLYLKNTVRQIGFTDAKTYPVVTEEPLDMSYSALRAVSLHHIGYLKTIRVKSSCSISLIINGKLFGLISCHHLDEPKVLNFLTFYALRVIGETCSLHLMYLLQLSHQKFLLKTERLLSTRKESTVSEFWSNTIKEFLALTNCQASVLIETGSKPKEKYAVAQSFGEKIDEIAICKLINRFLEVSSSSGHDVDESAIICNGIGNLYELLCEEKPSFIPAGCLVISCVTYIAIFFRQEVIKEFKWGDVGIIDKFKKLRSENKILSQEEKDALPTVCPQKSFNTFLEVRKGQCVIWSPTEILAMNAMKLRILQISSFEQSREKDLALSVASQKSAFLAHMSHELRTPFNGIIGMLNCLRSSPLSLEQKEMVDLSFESAEHMLSILDDVLLVSKIHANKLKLHYRQFNLNELVRNIMKLFKIRADQTLNNLKVEFDEEFGDIYSDPGRIRQIVMNLVSNALKYTSAGDVFVKVSSAKSEKSIDSGLTSLKVHIKQLFSDYEGSSKCESDVFEELDRLHLLKKEEMLDKERCKDLSTFKWFFFQISDSGIGMDAEMLSRLFMAFEQADTTSSRPYQGTGLGLYICKSLMELLGGVVVAFSTHKRGTTFLIALPLLTVSSSRKSSRGEDFPTIKLRSSETLGDFSTSTVDSLLGEPVLASIKSPRASMPEDSSLSPVSPSSFGMESPRSLDEDAVSESQQKLLSKGSFLCVDDNPVNLKVMSKVLESLSATTFVLCNGGPEAVELIKSSYSKFTCVLLDCHMPIMDGYQVATWIREFEADKFKGARLPIVAVTADVMSEVDERARGAGFDRVLRKPFNKTKLARVILELKAVHL